MILNNLVFIGINDKDFEELLKEECSIYSKEEKGETLILVIVRGETDEDIDKICKNVLLKIAIDNNRSN